MATQRTDTEVPPSDACPSHWFTEAVKAERKGDGQRMILCIRQLRRLGWNVLYTGRREKKGFN